MTTQLSTPTRSPGDGATLAAGLTAPVLVDASVTFNVQYCYQVFGYDRFGQLISATDVACVIV